MTKVKVDCYWIKELEVDYDNPVELYVEEYPSTPIPEGTVRFCLSHEPHPHLSKKAFAHPECYNYLLTWKQEHLNTIPNAIYFHSFNTRVIDYIFPPKVFGVSTVVGEKWEFEGHTMRHNLFFRQGEITIPRRFYLSGNKLWKGVDYTDQPLLDENSKDRLWDTQFSIAIENIFLNNWFTEKIVDCFLSKTVPVYIGAPNILDYFNGEGIVICKNLDDLIHTCNTLTPELYDSMRNAIEDNYQRSPQWTPQIPRLRDKMNLILKEHGKLHT